MVELDFVLIDQGATVPGVEALDLGSGGIEDFAQLIWLPRPREFNRGVAHRSHRDLRCANQFAAGKRNAVDHDRIFVLCLSDPRNLRQ